MKPEHKIGSRVRGISPVGKEVTGYYYGTTRYGKQIVYGTRWDGDASAMPHPQWLLDSVEPAPEGEVTMPLAGVEDAAARISKLQTQTQRETALARETGTLAKRHKKGRDVIREAINVRVVAFEDQDREKRVKEFARLPKAQRAKREKMGGEAFQAVLDKYGLEASAVSRAAQAGELYPDKPTSNRYVWLVTNHGGSSALLEKFSDAVSALAERWKEAK